jgi:hypothetical protein
MPQTAILAPVFLQVALTFGLLLLMGSKRLPAVQSGEVTLKDIALSSDAWPDHIRQVANSYANQFELPVLFYMAVTMALATGKADGAAVWLAWGFVLSRFVHAYIHITSNHVRQRFYAFAVGLALLAALWLVLGIRLFAMN